MTNWEKAYKIYDRIRTYEKQIEHLQKLGTQIADDRKKIVVRISHGNQKQEKQQGWMFPWNMMAEEPDYLENDDVDLIPFHLDFKDENALEFIGGMLAILKQQKLRLEKQLEKL